MTEELKDFLDGEELEPEDFFEMVTIMPKRKIKISAYLEDKDGERISLTTVSKNLNKYINKHMTNGENTPVNSQLFPLINQMMISSVPRSVGVAVSGFLFTAQSSRYALSMFGLNIALLMQYIHKHELKIVTEETPISEKQLEEYLAREEEAGIRLADAIGNFSDEEYEN